MKFWSAVLLTALLPACAAGPAVDKYPRALLDRPYTLPGSLAAWDTGIVGGYYKDTANDSIQLPIPNPTNWRSGLSDDWTLLWSPLPLGVRRQLWRSDQHVGGAEVGVGFGWGSTQGFTVFPHGALYERWRVSPLVGIEVTPSYQAIFSKLPFAANATFEIAPLFQVGPTVALGPRLYPTVGKPAMINLGFGSWFDDQFYDTFTLPLGAWIEWSFDRQWEVTLEFDHSSIGYQNSFHSDLLAIAFSHYW